ncbi:MAG: hypothetical protein IPK74_03600 [Deltaproteobacteria bacterium]|nr:hypothetical protein [Deltaproteobacteria bacterium]
MAKLPPPPQVGRGASPSDDASAPRVVPPAVAAAAADLPKAVLELPDEWLIDEPAASANKPAPTDAAAQDPAPDDDDAALEAAALASLVQGSEASSPSAGPTSADAAGPIAAPASAAVVSGATVHATAPKHPPQHGVTVRGGATERALDPPTTTPNAISRWAIGGVLAAACLAVIIARCSAGPSTATPDASRQALAGAGPAGGATLDRSANDGTARDGGAANGGAANGGAANGGAASGGAANGGAANGGADAARDGNGDAARDGNAAAQADDTKDAAAADAAQTDAAAAGDTKDAAAADAAQTDAAAADDAGAAAPTDDGRTDTVAQAGTTATATTATNRPSKSKGADSAAGAGERSSDAGLDAAEALERARAAWKAGNAKDTYKYANKSRYKQPSGEGNELATLAACKMKLDEAAKSSFKLLDGERRKRTRNACRDFGVRVGL